MSKQPRKPSGRVKLIPLTDAWMDKAKVSVEARKHLLRSQKSLLKKKDPTPSFPLYGSRDAVTVITRFLDSLPWDDYNLPPGWKEYEYGRLKKVGPQGGHPSWKEIEPLFMLYQERLSPVLHVTESTIQELRDKYIAVFPTPVSPVSADLSLAQLLSHDKINGTAAGCRSFNLKKTDPEAQRLAVYDIKTKLFDLFRMYVFERFSKLKPRIFMPGPFSNMIDQAAYLVPVMDQVQRSLRASSDSPLYHFADKIGFDEMFHRIFPFQAEKALLRLKRRLRRMGKRFDRSKVIFLYVQGDFEKMDTTTGPQQYAKLYIPITEVSIDPKFRDAYAESMMKTTTMPIISPSGVMIGDHGTGSGMENTNDGEKNCNLYYGTETKHRVDQICATQMQGLIYEWAGDYYNGDDSDFNVILYDVSDDDVDTFKNIFQQCAETVAHECGFRINEKWRMDTHFGLYNQNGFWFEWQDDDHLICTYMYPSVLILNSIMNPEHQYSKASWDKDYRDLDIIEKSDNGRYLPYHHKLVDFVDNGMKYGLLRRSEQESRRILSKWGRYRALQSLSERYNRQDYVISSSPTVNYVLSKLA